MSYLNPDEQAVADRVHSLLEQKLALGAGMPDWVELVKMVQNETGLSYKQAMSVASPLWRKMRGSGGAIRAPPKKSRGSAGALVGDGVLAGNASSMGAGVSKAECAEVLNEMLGAGFSRQDVVAAAAKVLPIIHKIAAHLIPHITDEETQKHLAPLLDDAVLALSEHLSGSGAMRPRSSGRQRSKSRSRSRPRASVSARPASRAKSRGKSRSKSRSKSRPRAAGGVRSVSRSKSRSRSRPKSRPKSRPRAAGGARPKSRSASRPKGRLSAYHSGLARYKAQHPSMSHKQAVQSFKKVYRR